MLNLHKKVAKTKYKELRLILGDQLNAAHSWYHSVDDTVVYLIAELKQETNYTTHHIQKVCAFFKAMEGFALALKNVGHEVCYLTLDDTSEYDDLTQLLNDIVSALEIECFSYQLPDEHRVRQQLAQYCFSLQIASHAYESEHFFISDTNIKHYFKAGKQHRMEHFYRKLRREFNVLMNGDKPYGEQWNFDADNRAKLKPADLAEVPQPLLFSNDVEAILARLKRHKINTMGTSHDQLLWPVNRQQALTLLDFFCQYCLKNFGRFQDAMTAQLGGEVNDAGWSLYHSRLSFALNSKMLSPHIVVARAIDAYHNANGTIDIAQIEGFVRQILGWREFIRGIYWANMPNYKSLNQLNAQAHLPAWFWDGNTSMNCQHHAIAQSLQTSYAHHIQRLMITGNFCLLAGINPDEVDEWYLGIYIDALEWVELPNTRGMSQFADGGIVGSKAYAGSGNYVNKMSDYCKSCAYDVKQITGDNACPLNSLYWRFMVLHETHFNNNPRNKMVYATWYKKSESERAKIIEQANVYLNQINEL